MRTERLVLSFSPESIRKPVTYLLVSNYKLRLNILRAKVKPGEEGRLLLEISGEDDRIREGLDYLSSMGVRMERVERFYTVDHPRCVGTKECFKVCPTNAIVLQPSEGKNVDILSEECILCEKCAEVCPQQVFSFSF